MLLLCIMHVQKINRRFNHRIVIIFENCILICKQLLLTIQYIYYIMFLISIILNFYNVIVRKKNYYMLLNEY